MLEGDYALLLLAVSHTSAPSIGISVYLEWVPARPNPVGRGKAILVGNATASPCAYADGVT